MFGLRSLRTRRHVQHHVPLITFSGHTRIPHMDRTRALNIFAKIIIVFLFYRPMMGGSQGRTNQKGTLYAGPWVGEFGWELCHWNILLRRRAQEFDKVIIASHASSRYLYEFADEFIPLQTDGGFALYQGKLLDPRPVVKADCHMHPRADGFPPGWRKMNFHYAWRNLNPGSSAKVADVLCAFRPPKGKNARKSYARGLCQRLVDDLRRRGLTVACYGGPSNYWCDGAIDLRGRPLEEQCAALGAAGCAVGPSSGTMHLAALCGCPVVTWFIPSSHPRLHLRYIRAWNPFHVPVAFLKDKPPAPESIASVTEGIILSG